MSRRAFWFVILMSATAWGFLLWFMATLAT